MRCQSAKVRVDRQRWIEGEAGDVVAMINGLWV